MIRKLLTHKNRMIASLLVFLPILFFQNCSDVKFGDIQLTEAQLALQSPSMRINNGDTYTNDTAVMVQLDCYGGKEMYLTTDPTCQDGGEWEPFRPERGWVLDQENKQAHVYAKFKRTDMRQREEITGCISANIIHDDIAPAVRFDSGPDALTQKQDGIFEFTVTDETSGVEKVECQLNGLGFKECDRTAEVKDLDEATHRFNVRAMDKAGNLSQPVEYPWLIDRTRPSVRLLDPKPMALSTSKTASLNFAADDGGSGIDKIICQINNEAAAVCVSPFIRTDLPEGPNTFSVYSIDKVGLMSDMIKYDWLIDTTPSGDFTILGITGAKDTKLDEFLAGDSYPKLNWTKSADAVSYQASVLNANGSQVVCNNVSVTGLNYQFPNSCSLQNGVSYRANVVAYDVAGHMTAAPQYMFTVDISGPQIAIETPVTKSVDQTMVTVKFTVIDPVSGIDNVTCRHTYNNMTVSKSCKNLTELTLENLLPGDHQFDIVATDRAGNTSASEVVTFELDQLTLENQVVTVEAPPTAIDVLMVIDNSGSMVEERAQLSTKLNDFISKLEPLDWRVCLTSTSPRNDGQLRPFASNMYAIDKNVPDYNNLFLNLVKGYIGNTSGDEQGIYATVRAIETNDDRCFREGAALAVVLISDEDERSVGGYPENEDHNQYKKLGEKNYPSAALEAVKSKYGEKKIFTFHSIVIKNQDTQCLSQANGSYGRRYEELSALSSGIVGSICSENYGTELAAMGERTKINLETISLRCSPVEGTLKVVVNPAAQGQTFSVTGNKITFSPKLAEGSVVQLEYYCSK